MYGVCYRYDSGHIEMACLCADQYNAQTIADLLNAKENSDRWHVQLNVTVEDFKASA